MSCNPAIGGLGKGHLVKEVDALGGIMGRAIDATGIQFRTLNSSKGPAVRASRAQADRRLYREEVRRICEQQQHLTIIEGEVASFDIAHGRVRGVHLADGTTIPCGAVVLTTGTFLRGLMHTGPNQTEGGRSGDRSAHALSDALRALGFPLGRLKTGTPARLRRSTINFSLLQEQPGDSPPSPFSMMSEPITRPQISCWLTETNAAVHEVIEESRERSPMFNGQIKSGGPRYCPSIEDKVFRFADKERHTVFLEPEGFDSDVVYPNGISTSLPLDVQERFVRLIRGLESVEILHPGYAVEYDFVDPRALRPTLETKEIKGLFHAGQINGTSGYEEAAAQGLIAGANAALGLLERDPLTVSRGTAYIGVMIDDLVTSGVDEPYRMFTSRAEYRLILREDNAPSRLCPIGIEYGLVPLDQVARFRRHEAEMDHARRWVEQTRIKPTVETNEWLSTLSSAPLKDSLTLETLLRRPEMTLDALLDQIEFEGSLSAAQRASLEIEVKFRGYLTHQEEEVKKLKRNEHEVIPADFSYDAIPGLRTEAREKFKSHRPASLGQALRIPGITPTAVSLLAIHLKRHASESQDRST
jgi:tRNA uridine 5-carboxymethylaminomethyl modification enzyme